MNKISNILISFILLLSLLVLIVPIFPVLPSVGLDPSWHLGMSYLIAKKINFGSELIFTYGPFSNFSFPLIVFDPKLFHIQVLTAISVSILITATTLFSFIHLKKEKFFFLCVLLIFGLVFGGSIPFLLQLLFVISIIKTTNKYGLILSYLLIISMAFSTLIKFSFFPTAFILVIFADIVSYYKYNKITFFSITFLSAMLLLFVVSGQNVDNFYNFIIGSLQISSGYSEAMQLPGRNSIVVLFLLLSGWLVFSLIKDFLEDKTIDRLFVSISLLLILFMGFKLGFVRFDAHVIQAFGILLMVVSFLYAIDEKKKSCHILLIISLFSSLLVTASYSNKDTFTLLYDVVQDYKNKLNALPNVFSDERKQDLSQSYKTALNTIKIKDPLPLLTGTVDIYPWNIATIIAHGYEYKPRPVFQSYSVYTENLINKNKTFLQSNQAPENIVFNIQEIDNRLASMMEGATWLDILNYYKISDLLENYVLLSKRNKYKERFLLEKSQSITAKFDEQIFLPEDIDILWSSIEINKTFLGKITNTLYRSPVLYIELTYKNGITTKNRLVPAIAKSGFILSPQITNKEDFVRFNFNPSLLFLDRKIVSMKITGNNFYKQAYNNNFTINFQKIKFIKNTSEQINSNKINKIISYSTGN